VEGNIIGMVYNKSIRAYIETTIFNRFFDENREYVAATRAFFDEIREGKIDAYTSTYVIDELEKAPSPKREAMLKLISDYEIEVLEYNDAAFDLADTYIERSIIPKKSRVDGVHIAMAAINNMDCIVSLNFKHINKIKTKILTENVHNRLGYSNPIICMPMEVFDDE
jgi:predicted nucleic acid-binding protein